MFEEICYNCCYSHDCDYYGLGLCLKYHIKKLVREEQTCKDYVEDSEPIYEDDED